MRVLHVLDHSIPLHSGYTFRTRAILREQRRLGWETFHLTTPRHTAPGPAQETVDGLEFFRTHWMPAGPEAWPVLREWAVMGATTRRLAQVAAQVRPDIIHAHSPVLNAWPAIRVARARGIPVVYEVRAFWEDAAVDHGTTTEGSLRYRATRALETAAFRRVDAITTICEGLRADIAARGIAPEKITVIPNAVDVAEFRFQEPRDEALAARLGVADQTVIGFLGSFYAYEGLDLLLAALPQVLAARPDARVLLVGGGPQEAALKAQARDLGVSDKVLFVGRVPHAEVQKYYGLVDVLAYPRHPMRLTELVTPLKPLEAMAQGKLVVASDVGGHRELIRDGETGRLFAAGSAPALADALLIMLAERERWPALRAAGRRFVEAERTWARSVAAYEPLFNALVSRGASPRPRPA